MAIKGNVTVKGIPVADAYVKAKIGSISERMVPVMNTANPPVQTGERKQHVLNYDYEVRATKEAEPFHKWSGAVADPDLNANPYATAYAHLAAELNISGQEV